MNYTTGTTKENVMSESQSKGGGVFVLLLPVILVSAVSSLVGFFAAKAGVGKGMVRLLLLPANFLMSNFIGICLFVPMNFMWNFFRGKREMLYPRITDFLDLTLFSVWGRFIGWFYNFSDTAGVTAAAYASQVPVVHIIIFQLVLWMLIGRFIASMWTDCIMALAGRSQVT